MGLGVILQLPRFLWSHHNKNKNKNKNLLLPIKVPQEANNLIQWFKWLETYKDTCKHTQKQENIFMFSDCIIWIKIPHRIIIACIYIYYLLQIKKSLSYCLTWRVFGSVWKCILYICVSLATLRYRIDLLIIDHLFVSLATLRYRIDLLIIDHLFCIQKHQLSCLWYHFAESLGNLTYQSLKIVIWWRYVYQEGRSRSGTIAIHFFKSMGQNYVTICVWDCIKKLKLIYTNVTGTLIYLRLYEP